MQKPIKIKSGYFKSFDDTEIYYEVRGEGKPLVFAYGIGCLFNHWLYQTKYFPHKYQTILFDYRSHQKSKIPEGHQNLDIESLAKDMLSLLKHLEINTAGFIGHSFGAQVLIEAYHQAPEVFSNMTFINGFVSNPLKGMFGNDASSKIFSFIKETNSLLPESSRFLWSTVISSPISVPVMGMLGGFNLNLTSYKDMEIYTNGISSIDLKSFLSLFEGMTLYDGTKYLKDIKVPTLIISGEKDSVTPLKHQRSMHNRIPNSELTIMPYGSHCTQLDLPDYVNLRIEKFLDSHEY